MRLSEGCVGYTISVIFCLSEGCEGHDVVVEYYICFESSASRIMAVCYVALSMPYYGCIKWACLSAMKAVS